MFLFCFRFFCLFVFVGGGFGFWVFGCVFFFFPSKEDGTKGLNQPKQTLVESTNCFGFAACLSMTVQNITTRVHKYLYIVSIQRFLLGLYIVFHSISLSS